MSSSTRTLVVDQITGRSDVGSSLRRHHQKAMDLVQQYGGRIRISWIPREWNAEADLLANLALAR